MPEDDPLPPDFDRLMDGLGVRPMAPRKGAPNKGGGGRSAPPRPATQGHRPPANTAPGGTTPSAARPATAPSTPSPQDVALQAALQEAQAERQALKDQVAGLQAELLAQVDRMGEAQRHRAALQRQLQLAQEQAVDPPGDLLELLRQRGLRGNDEPRLAIAALAGARQIDDLLPLLVPRDPAQVAARLEEDLSLSCGDDLCLPATGRAWLQVAPDRCEVCGGSDVARLARRFLEACLGMGFLKVAIVGGSPRYHRTLQRLLVHDRVRVRLLAGDARIDLQGARAQERGHDLLILWGGTILDHRVSELYRGEECRLLRIDHRGLSGMLERAQAALLR
jgi:hypothetical protein